MPNLSKLPFGRWLTFAVLRVGCFVAACWLAGWLATTFAVQQARTEVASPRVYEIGGIVVPPSALQIGEVWENNKFELKLPLRNASSSQLRVLEVQAGCSCVEVSPGNFTLRPKETIELKLTIDLTKRAPWERHQDNRPVALDIRPLIDGVALSNRAWLVEGIVRSRITLDVESLGFGDRPVSGSVNAPRTIKAQLHASEGELAAKVVPYGAGSVTVSWLKEGEYALAVAPAASLPPGAFAFHVEFSMLDSDGKRIQAGRTLPVTGVMQPEIRAFPAQVLLGTKEVGSTAETVVQLQSPPGSGWVVDRVEVDSPDLKIEPNGADYRIRQKVTGEGDHFSIVKFFVRNSKAGKVTPLRMTVSYFGQKAKEKP